MYSAVEATMQHVEALRGRLRESDLLEIKAHTGRDPYESLKEAFEMSGLCWAGLRKGKVIALFGAASVSVLSTIGAPWMLGSEELNSAGIGILKFSRYYVSKMRERFSYLTNFIDARQTKSIRWLKWNGFKIEEPKPFGVEGKPFHCFWMGDKYV